MQKPKKTFTENKTISRTRYVVHFADSARKNGLLGPRKKCKTTHCRPPKKKVRETLSTETGVREMRRAPRPEKNPFLSRMPTSDRAITWKGKGRNGRTPRLPGCPQSRSPDYPNCRISEPPGSRISEPPDPARALRPPRTRNSEFPKIGNLEIRKFGNSEIRKFGNSAIRKFGNSEIRKFGSSEIR